jgi:excisionase family DNA binding protein
MEPYTLTTASEAVRKSKSTILRAIQKGRLSATRTDNGGWLIDPSELHRVFPNGLHVPHAQHSTAQSNALQPRNVTAVLHARLEATEARLTDARELIDTLWRRLDRADEERRQVQARLDAVLTDQRATPPAPIRRWWTWGWRR